MYKNPLRLTQPLGSSYPANEEDVLSMKSALSDLGEYKTPSYGMTGFTDDALFDGVKRFQKKRGLAQDGIAKPGGPTETSVNSALAKTKTQPAASRPLLTVLKPAKTRRPHTRPASFGVSSGIGEGQTNRTEDVKSTKRALAWAGYYPKTRAQQPDGSADEDMQWGLRGFQRDFGLKLDGILRPGGETATTLNELITPLVQLAAAEPAPENTPDEKPDQEHPEQTPPPEGEDDTNHDQKCRSLQAEADRLRQLEKEWEEKAMFLNLDIADVEGADQAKYINLVENLTKYVHRPNAQDRMDERRSEFFDTFRPQNASPESFFSMFGKQRRGKPNPPRNTAPPKRDTTQTDSFLRSLTDPSWYPEIRKYRGDAQKEAFKKMMEFSRERTDVITEGENERCFVR